MLRLQDKPRTSLGHHKDIVKAKKRQKGQAEDKPRTSRGQKKGLRRVATTESTPPPNVEPQIYILADDEHEHRLEKQTHYNMHTNEHTHF